MAVSRVRYDNPCPKKNIEERINFSFDVPYTVRIKKFDLRDDVPLHYGKTLEITVCKGVRGVMYIDGMSYEINNDIQVFVIPPYVVHGSQKEIGPGLEYIIKFDLEVLSQFVNIENLLKYEMVRLDQFNVCCKYTEEVLRIAENLVEHDDNIFVCISLLVSLVDILRRDAYKVDLATKKSHDKQNEKLWELVNWTEANYAEKLSVEKAADRIGFSKYYFCTYFKKQTGISYIDYLNRVRISNACKLLVAGEPVQNVCNAVGFESVSYFIKLFKKVQGMTPTQYIEFTKSN